MPEPRRGPCHQQLGLDLEAILFGRLHGLSHDPKGGRCGGGITPSRSQRPKTDSLQAKALVSARYTLFGVRQFCVHAKHDVTVDPL